MTIRKYRVREGFRYGPHDEYAAGTIVELEESTARFEMDKLELAEIVQNVPDDSGGGEEAQSTPPTTPDATALSEAMEGEEEKPTRTSPRRKSTGD